MTIREIAKIAGVSPATISRFFNCPVTLSPPLRAKIKTIVTNHHYHPRLNNYQRNVVILLPYNAVYPVQSCVDMLLSSLTQILPQNNFRMEILPINSMDRLNNIQFCAAVAIGIDSSQFQNWDKQFQVPLIILDRDMKCIPQNVYIIHSDERQGMDLGIEHLIQNGCKKPGIIIHGAPGLGNATCRYKAIIQSLKKNNVAFNQSLIYFSGTDDTSYVEIIGRLLQKGIDSLFCPGGNAGILSMYALSLFNRKVPDDLSLITSELTFFSAYGIPPQTTITQQYRELAYRTTECIENAINNLPSPHRLTLPYTLITRDSV